MATEIAPCLFVESSLNVEPTTHNSFLHISTVGSSGFQSRKRPRLDNAAPLDEEQFAKKHLASESGIFHRSRARSPRNILWRILDERKVLEVQSVDLTQDKKSTLESVLTFTLDFPAPIRANGVAFADASSHDALDVFVLTTSNELFTVSLRRDLLLLQTPPASSEFDPSTCFQSHTLSSFSFRYPYRLVALSDLDLMISLHDGALLRLERRVGEGGAAWRETFFHEGGWGSSLRGLISWKGQNTVRFGDIDLSPNTAAAVQSSPSGEHVLTVGLDHSLKAWNARTGKIGFQVDLLGEPRSEGRVGDQYLINPDQTSLLKVFDVQNKPDGDAFYCVVYSPKTHQLKFWAVRDADSAEYGIRDMVPDVDLVPPIDTLMDTNVWHLADLEISPGPGWQNTRLWIRARSGSTCRIFTLAFDLLGSRDDLEYAWKHQWCSVAEGFSTADQLANSTEFRHLSSEENLEVRSVTDEWFAFLLYPNRFSAASLETALHTYQKGQGLLNVAKLSDRTAPLQERIRIATLSGARSKRPQTNLGSNETRSLEVSAQLRIFYGLVRHLHQSRGDSLALSLDVETGLAWSVRADQISPIRSCSESEVYTLNADLFSTMDDDWLLNSLPLASSLLDDAAPSAARLLSASRNFRKTLPTALDADFERLASLQALRDGEAHLTPRSRKHETTPLQQLYEHCGFAGAVGDDDFDRLTESVQDLGGLGAIENELFEALIDRLGEAPHGQEREHSLARYGDKATIKGAQDTLSEGRRTILDLLALAVFMSQDLETDELARGFRPMELYSTLMNKLREFDLLLWMAGNTRVEISKKGDSDAPQQGDAGGQPLTMLESVFIGDWSSMSFPDEPLTSLLTYWSRAWTFGSSLGIEYAGVTAHIMGNLLKHEDFQLAYEFSRFLPQNSWTTYLKGRLYLSQGEHAIAASSFKQAAADMARTSARKSQSIDTVDTAGLLSPIERQYFLSGLPRYYLHITSLLEAEKLPAYVVDFASLALAVLEEESAESLDSSMMDIDNRKRSTQDSPVAVRVDLAMEEIRLLKTSEAKEDVLSRLFSAALRIGLYQAAFDALVKSTNPAIKHAHLTQLLTSILATDPPLLLSLPFPAPLAEKVDATLVALARNPAAAAASPVPVALHHILYAWRVSRGNYRKAAEGLFERLGALQRGSGDEATGREEAAEEEEGEDGEQAAELDEVLQTYLVLINTLACCGPGEGWILASTAEDTAGPGRRLITLEDVRAGYQAELDRRSEIAQGRFALLGREGPGMDVDVF